MNKIEFLERLEKLLADVPYTERREALNYYTEYFEDADKDEAEVIRTLGSPEEVAHNIREELAGKELAERGAQDTADGETSRSREQRRSDAGAYDGAYREGGYAQGAAKEEKKKSKLEGWQVVLIVLAVVLTVPIWGSIVTGILGVVLGVIAGILGVVVGLAAAAIALFAAAVVVFVISIAKLFATPLASVFCMGLSIFMIGLAMLFLITSWKLVTVLIPAIWKGLTYIFHSVFGKKEGVGA